MPDRAERPSLVVFVHIPKTAGTTVRTIFKHGYPEAAIRNSGNAFRDPERSRLRVERLARGTGAGTRVVIGHTPFGTHKAHFAPDTVYFTVLRDPVDQTLSLYHYLFALPPEHQKSELFATREGPRPLPLPSKETSIAEMLEQGVYLLDNMATRMLSDRETPYGELKPDDLQQAKDNLARFAVVGITERLDESIVLMLRTLGLGLLPYASHNVNVARPGLQAISAAQRKLIEEHNSLDLELYSHAHRLFEERLEAAGAALKAEVQELRRISSGRDQPEARLVSPAHRAHRRRRAGARGNGRGVEEEPQGSRGGQPRRSVSLGEGVSSDKTNPPVLDELRRLEQLVADLREEVRELEGRLEQLEGSPTRARGAKAPKAERAQKQSKAERAAAKKRARAAKEGSDHPPEEGDSDHDS